jgi:chromosome segregation ATPase
VQFPYNYNPVWVSFRPTFWASFLAVVGCVAVIFFRRRKPSEEEPTVTKTERLTTLKQEKGVEPKTGQHVTVDNVREFTEAYEEKKQLNAELKSLDSRAQKGKIPRRQYKVQRRALEIRLEGLTRNIDRLKDVFIGSSGIYGDLVKQLDSAEADLVEAEENIRSLELRQSKGEISLEVYKRNIGDFQRRKEKAESVINGILLRLREKIH